MIGRGVASMSTPTGTNGVVGRMLARHDTASNIHVPTTNNIRHTGDRISVCCWCVSWGSVYPGTPIGGLSLRDRWYIVLRAILKGINHG